ncbi:MAG: tetratricopeptide repeat protein [Methylococcaceae bacterium]|nr:tetratricopeptide repeat protein [Methylococcaceae bacterium]MDZ4157215.1 tetratricopeptide repeat protein [Methylococcales bacterium]MDP2392504.1 tetratricopeptide repeat protein [Methylococcaceae bacterium]MDP3021005.1 tetratricopeptide repeat protein [Methylococcaceae bacterium]MDP3388392.1 tetratricopeptide repeat protein [Methylococcaceae bacterium]
MPQQNIFSLSELQQKAIDGNALAQLALGLYYLPKEIWESNEGWEFRDRLYWAYRLASLDGPILEPEIYSAFELFETSNEANAKSAFEWFKKAAEQGRAESQYAIARCYYEGKGTEQNDKLAFEWAKKSGDQNFAEAFCLLGDLYSQGRGVEQDDEQALAYYEDAANQGITRTYIKKIKMIVRAKGIVDFDKAKDDIGIFENKISDRLNNNLKQCKEQRFFGENIIYAGPITIDVPEDDEDLSEEALDRIASDTRWLNRELKELSLVTIEYKQELEAKNKALEAEIKQKELLQIKMQKLVEQFTHTLGNVIFPDTIYQVAERLKTNPDCRKDVLLLNEAYHSEIIIKLQGELLRQRHTSTNPEKFRQLIRACRQTSNIGDKTRSIGDVLDYAASRVTARFLNQHNASLGSIRDNILSRKNVSLDDLKQKFEDDILLNRSLGSVEWINQNLRPFKVVNISPLWQKVFILAESHAEALLFGHFSEVLFNAFKYADHATDEFLTVVFDERLIDGKTYLTCSWQNPLGDKAVNSLGTGKGLEAIQEDLMQLNDTPSQSSSLLAAQERQQFKVTMFFKKDLLINDAPTIKIPR